MLEKILVKLLSRILRKHLTSFHQRRFSVMLPEHLQDCYATRTFARNNFHNFDLRASST